ncbi:MAG: hypothetical protein NTW21_09075 [Verrucomicrobia bacterium]|nr:hypothetical protein [Verrucomicrobiota bacterium]
MSAKGGLDPAEWDFSNVPTEELPAGFLWEYARESAWFRNLRERCLAFHRSGGFWASDPALDGDLRRVQEAMPYASEVFLRGFFFEPGEETQSDDPEAANYRHPEAPAITGSFPDAPWQSLTEAERRERAHIRSDVETCSLVPFERGYDFDCDLIRDYAKRVRAGQIAERGHAENGPSSIQWAGGTEEGIFQIQWASFTDKAIADYFRQWVKANRPANIPEPRKNGDKTEDRRAWLEWLGVMRCLHCHMFALHAFPERFKARGQAEIYRMRKKAWRRFRELFDFLPEPTGWKFRTRCGRF